MHYGISESHTTNHSIRYLSDGYIDVKCDALRDLVAFVQFKNVKDTHGGVLILIKLQAKTIFIEKESKTPYGCPTFIFYQKYF